MTSLLGTVGSLVPLLLNTTTTTLDSVVRELASLPTAAQTIANYMSWTTTSLLLIPEYLEQSAREHEDIASRRTYDRSTPFDFIVVGGGAGGAVVASRLSENPFVRVLLLEAGGAESIHTDIPAMDAINTILPTESSKYTTFLTVPQKVGAQGLPNRQVPILTGTVLGGGSTINGMMYNRGGADDFDGWARDYGCTSWSFLEVLPFFKKSENNVDPQVTRINPLYHGTNGPLTVSSLDENQMTPPYRLVSDTLMKAYSQLGTLGQPTDFNGPNPLGSTTAQRNIKDGKRQSTSTAFLEPVYKERPNLQILTHATVTRVNFEGKRATGVTFYWNGREEVVRVRREVILCAGAVNTAKILLLSGVGPAGHLRDKGIPLVADLPVGQNFQDHVRVGGLDFNVNALSFSYFAEIINPLNWAQRSLNGGGPLAHDPYLHQAAFLNIRTSVSNRSQLYGPSDLFLAPSLTPVPLVALTIAQNQIRPDILAKYYLPNFLEPQLNLYVTLNYARSRGSITLRSNRYSDPPLVDPAYFTDEHGDDLARAVEGYRLGLKLLETDAFKSIGARLFKTRVPGCSGGKESREYIECVVKTLSSTEFHPCCSVRMGGNDPRIKAVLDPRLRVRGIRGLRVADASVMPFAVTANTMAATIMIGEKGAHMILEDHNLISKATNSIIF